MNKTKLYQIFYDLHFNYVNLLQQFPRQICSAVTQKHKVMLAFSDFQLTLAPRVHLFSFFLNILNVLNLCKCHN